MPITLQDDFFTSQISQFVAEVKEKAADGLTLAEAAELLNDFLARSIAIAETLSNPGADKKALVLAAVGSAFDAVWPFVVLPGWLVVFKPFIYSTARAVVLAIVDGSIQAMVSRMRQQKPL